MSIARERVARAVLFAVLVISSSCSGPSPTPSIIWHPTSGDLGAAGDLAEPTERPLLPEAAQINPLTGQPVADPSLLEIPAVLISISHFPATARPQAGLSFAPYIYEYYITEGMTRFLAVFHGEFPAVESIAYGGCETRTGAITRTENVLGNLVWFDVNVNGIQDPGERGVSGLCVNLYDANDNLIERTSTDSNGFYAFNVSPGPYSVEFAAPENLTFTLSHKGDAAADSDADDITGRANVKISGDDLSIDAGLVSAANAPLPTEDPGSLPLPQVGPIRSGRLIYGHVAHYFENSCLIFASASPEVLALLPECLTVFHQISGGGFMLDLDEMEAVARQNARRSRTPFNYSGNRFEPAVPGGGASASELKVVIAYQNQSGWYYDAASQSYLRYVDTSEYEQPGVLHPEVDRLTGRQLHFENLIVLYARHDVVSPTNLDIHLEAGRTGKALLLRDGRILDISWETTSPKDADVGPVRPIRFLGKDGQPAPLRPGHTWILVVTPESSIEQREPGKWLLTFAQPEGAK